MGEVLEVETGGGAWGGGGGFRPITPCLPEVVYQQDTVFHAVSALTFFVQTRSVCVCVSVCLSVCVCQLIFRLHTCCFSSN